jgi:hypothetical protein
VLERRPAVLSTGGLETETLALHEPLQAAVFVLGDRSFRSSLTPRWAYFFFQM